MNHKKYSIEFINKVVEYYNSHTVYELEHNSDLFLKGKPIKMSYFLNRIHKYDNQIPFIPQKQRLQNIILRFYDIIIEYQHKYPYDWSKKFTEDYHLNYNWISIFKRINRGKGRFDGIKDKGIFNTITNRNKRISELKQIPNLTSAKCCKVLQCEVARDIFTNYLDGFESVYTQIQIDYDIIRTLIISLEKWIYKKGIPSYTPKRVCVIALACYTTVINPNHHSLTSITKQKLYLFFGIDHFNIRNSLNALFTDQQYNAFLTFIKTRIDQSHSILSQPIDLFDP